MSCGWPDEDCTCWVMSGKAEIGEVSPLQLGPTPAGKRTATEVAATDAAFQVQVNNLKELMDQWRNAVWDNVFDEEAIATMGKNLLDEVNDTTKDYISAMMGPGGWGFMNVRHCDWCEAWTTDNGSPCTHCGKPALDKTNMVPCAWASQHASMSKGKAGCPACKGSGYVEKLEADRTLFIR